MNAAGRSVQHESLLKGDLKVQGQSPPPFPVSQPETSARADARANARAGARAGARTGARKAHLISAKDWTQRAATLRIRSAIKGWMGYDHFTRGTE